MQLLANLNTSVLGSKSVAVVVPLNQAAELVLTTLIFSVLGIILFALAFFIIVKVTPFSVRKEIEEDHNVALAIVIGSVIIGIGIIIAAAVSG